VTADLRQAVLLSFDNLGEAADIERHAAPEGGVPGEHPSVSVGLPRALEALEAVDLHATFFVEGLNAELYPDALRAIAAAGHEVGLHGWRHEQWDTLEPEEEAELVGRGVAALRGLGLEVEGFRPPGGALGPHSIATLAAHGVRWISPLGERPAVKGGVVSLPFRWDAVDAYHRMESFAQRRLARGDRADVASPRETADALIAALDARGDAPLVLILHPFLLLDDDEARETRRVLEHLAAQVAAGTRHVAPGRELAALAAAQLGASTKSNCAVA
jgi:peptidoglycan/xylan/chitin deacetylase (PgdA/CDA1 family)